MVKKRVYRLTPEESERRLDEFLAEAKAGMMDEDLAVLAEVSKKSVAVWRTKNSIRRLSGHLRKQEKNQSVIAANLFGSPLPDVLQRVHTSPVFGRWATPRYTMREGVHYDMLLEQVYALHTMFGYSEENIALAFGLTKKTVRDALAIYTEWVTEKNNTCVACGMPIPPSMDYCSRRCRDE